MKRSLATLIILSSLSLFAAPKQLTLQDIRPSLEDLFTYHIEYKELSPVIIRRSLKIYIEQFDLERTYLLAEEVKPFLELTPDQVSRAIEQVHHNQYVVYQSLNQTISKAIMRARGWRTQIESAWIQNPGAMQANDKSFDFEFASQEQQLFERNKMLVKRFLDAERGPSKKPLTSEMCEKIFALLERRLQKFENGYLDGMMPEQDFALHILKAFAKSMDAHTSYFSADEAREMRASLEKQFEGVGVILREGVDGVYISGLVKGGPAERSKKVSIGDFLVAINGEKVEGTPYDQVLDKMKGDKDQRLALGLRRYGQQGQVDLIDVELTREKIVMEDDRLTFTAEPFGGGIIGKLELPSFYESGPDSSCEIDMREAIKALKKKGQLLGLVIDMRENSGGFLNQAVKVAGLFITSGVVVISKYSHGEVQYLRNIDGRAYFNGPIIILTSKASASAAEIVAQALQDYGTALIVGDERTYGKGTIQYQTVTDDDAGSFFKVTVGKYYTVSGRSAQIEGVKADISVPTAYAYFNIGERFLEYPLPNDQVPAAYIDPLTDLDEQTKRWFQKNYLPTLQQKLSQWRQMLPVLRSNSQFRLSNDPNFKLYYSRLEQNKGEFLRPAKGKENWGTQDVQMTEAVSILKDMIIKQTLFLPQGTKK
jgi:carboxyl-terminal processing protease